MARPRKTADQLQQSGAPAGRVAKRRAEEAIAAGIVAVEKQKELAKRGLLLETFIAQVKQERDTFFERLVPGQKVCKEYFHESAKSVPSMKASDERIWRRGMA
jgi:hypothetical protein